MELLPLQSLKKGGFMWSIVELEHHVSDGLVITAHWQLTAEGLGKTAQLIGSLTLPAKDPTDPSFIPFDELTEDVVIGWVKAQLGEEQVTELKASAESQLAALISPATVTGLPWSNA
jgi:hypothetical protein